MIKKFMPLFVIIILMAGLKNTVTAQTSASVNSTTAGVKLIVPICMTQSSALYFGTITDLAGTGGTCMAPSNSTTSSFSDSLATSKVAPLPTNTVYSITGTKNATYALTMPSTITVIENKGSTTMEINSLHVRFIGAVSDATTSKFSSSGTDNFTLSGTLTAGKTQVGGIYKGTCDLSVDYN